MNQGDSLAVTIKDTPAGLETSIFDFNTGQSGYIVASAANGFMNTDPVTCNGSPFSFHPEYSTAGQQNQVAWADLEGGVLIEDEIGHFETCASLSNPLPFNATFGDPAMEQTCNGPSEAGGTEDGCSFTTGNCPGATTEGGAACPQPNFATPGELCEFSDAACFPAGPRTVDSNGIPEVVSWPVAGCQDNFGGDAEYGSPDVARFGGTLTSPVLPNPQFSGKCSLNSFR
jgi:hypothetical protein